MLITLLSPSRTEANQIIQRWEQEDRYYRSIRESVSGKLNMAARQYPYIESSENTVTRKEVDVKGIPLSTGLPYDLVYLDGRSDAGLPHTRGLHGIALPVFLLWNSDNSEKTIRHELVHLSQKQFPDRWWTLYEQVWHFRKCRSEEFMSIPERWRERRRVNPDTLGSPYTVWKDRFIPLSVFLSDTQPDLKACKRGFWDLRFSQWTWDPPPGWEDTFGNGFNDEHPNEIAAHWIDGSSTRERQTYLFARI